LIKQEQNIKQEYYKTHQS